MTHLSVLSARLGQRAQGGKWALCQGVQGLAVICHQTPTPQKHTQLRPLHVRGGFLLCDSFARKYIFPNCCFCHDVHYTQCDWLMPLFAVQKIILILKKKSEFLFAPEYD